MITVIKGSYMENTDIPQFRTYRGEIELEGVVIRDAIVMFGSLSLLGELHWKN